MPVTILPTSNCANVVEEARIAVPIIIIVPPEMIMNFLPKRSPTIKDIKDPTAQPIYEIDCVSSYSPL
jgi:hypothetical protein